jgi:hypothetical protein
MKTWPRGGFEDAVSQGIAPAKETIQSALLMPDKAFAVSDTVAAPKMLRLTLFFSGPYSASKKYKTFVEMLHSYDAAHLRGDEMICGTLT